MAKSSGSHLGFISAVLTRLSTITTYGVTGGPCGIRIRDLTPTIVCT